MTIAADRSRAWRQANPAKMLVYDARRRAQAKGVPFTITEADVTGLLEAGWTCVYCGIPVGSYSGGQRPSSVTLDRLIPSKGYTPGNVVICCHADNTSKAEHTPASLRAWADLIESVLNRQNPPETECSPSQPNTESSCMTNKSATPTTNSST